MSDVRVACLLCEHPVQVPASEIVLHRQGTGPAAVDRYGFTCPSCAVYVVRRANEATVEALLRTDEVEVAHGALPPWETVERQDIVLLDAGPSPQRAVASHAPPITEADVLLFREALADDAILAAWLTAE